MGLANKLLGRKCCNTSEIVKKNICSTLREAKKECINNSHQG